MIDSIDEKYKELVSDVIINGEEKEDRTGTGTISVFSRDIRHDMTKGFPLLTTKRMGFKTIRRELEWFLNGGTNIRPLVLQNCNIWNGDAYKYYCKSYAGKDKLSMPEFITKIKEDNGFSLVWGELGPIYGKQWKNWRGIDQISNLVSDLNTNPNSRRLMVMAWNVDELNEMVLPPCHFGFQCYTRKAQPKHIKSWCDNHGFVYEDVQIIMGRGEETYGDFKIPTLALSLKWYQRSVDVPLGLPFNIASYGLLLEMLANEVNMVSDELIGSLGDTHIYLNQINCMGPQLSRMGLKLPKIKVTNGINSRGDKDIQLIDYVSHDRINIPLSN